MADNTTITVELDNNDIVLLRWAISAAIAAASSHFSDGPQMKQKEGFNTIAALDLLDEKIYEQVRE